MEFSDSFLSALRNARPVDAEWPSVDDLTASLDNGTLQGQPELRQRWGF